MKTLNSDKALLNKEDDKFNRYGFARRIAETIKRRKESECLVIGIYGAWGEGKTTLLNFIGIELSTEYPDLIVTRFNPWRFSGEEELIRGFYEELANEVVAADLPDEEKSKNKKIKLSVDKQKEPLKENKELYGGVLKNYGKFGELIGLGDALESLGSKISSVTIEILKDRLEKFLEEKKKRLVIVIDDIDRLDRDEVNSIFRLVKLNADFQNTIYILSFDEGMVSRMIGSRYGGEGAGINFLEKIIQVPLQIPKAHPENLRIFSLNLISEILDDLELMPDDGEARRFGELFNPYILKRLNTPRMAIRYANILNYSLPILKGEVNTVDLMLIEGLRIFYPDHYVLVRDNPDLFLKGFRNPYNSGQKAEAAEKLKMCLADAADDLSGDEKNAVEKLLCELFPRLNEAFDHGSNSERNSVHWIRERRVCSESYFHRYFTFGLLRNELSDKALDDFIMTVEKLQDEIGFELFQDITNDIDLDILISSLRYRENSFAWEVGARISKYLSWISDNLLRDESRLNFFSSPFEQAAIFIYRLVNRYKQDEPILSLVNEIIRTATSHEFASEFFRALVGKHSEHTPNETLSEEQKISAFLTLRDRLFSEFPDDRLFESVPNDASFLLTQWHYLLGSENLTAHITDLLKLKVDKSLGLVEIFTPFWRSSENPKGGGLGDFMQENYNSLKVIYSPSLLVEQLRNFVGKEKMEVIPEYFGKSRHNTLDNIAKQFYACYIEDTQSTGDGPQTNSDDVH